MPYRDEVTPPGTGCGARAFPTVEVVVCGVVPAYRVVAACVHEHIREARLCATHVEAGQAGMGCCTPCGQAGHTCPLRLEFVEGRPAGEWRAIPG